MRQAQATKLQRNRCIFVDFFKIMRRFRNRCVQEYKQMPIYEYRCDNCSHEFETIQKMSEEPLKTCPACAQDALRKKVSASGFRLKGAGWYETDFKSDRKRNVAGDEKAAKDGGESAKGGGESARNGGEASKGGGKDSGKDAAKGGGEKTTGDRTGASKSSDGSASGSGDKSSKSTSEGKGTSSTSKSSKAE
jgi:putative FmdB family regulatory protein